MKEQPVVHNNKESMLNPIWQNMTLKKSCPKQALPHTHVACPQKALMKEQPVVYNKESMLNPFFVVFGRRRATEGEAPAEGQGTQRR